MLIFFNCFLGGIGCLRSDGYNYARFLVLTPSPGSADLHARRRLQRGHPSPGQVSKRLGRASGVVDGLKRRRWVLRGEQPPWQRPQHELQRQLR